MVALIVCSEGLSVLPTEESKAPPIKVQKPSQRPINDLRDKACATCGRVFKLEPGQKFFDCPFCYRQKIAAQRRTGRLGTTVLTQINCASCGAVEFVRFVPEDPSTVLCRPCYVKKAREQKLDRRH